MSENIIEIINNDYTFEIENLSNIIELTDLTYEISVDNITNADYSSALNKPKINSVELSGNKSSSDLGLASLSALSLKENSSNKVTSINSLSDDEKYPSAKCVYNELQNKQNTLVSGENIKTINGASLLGSENIILAKSDLSNISATGEAHFDDRYINVTGDTMSGGLTVNDTIQANTFVSYGGQAKIGSIELGTGGTSAWNNGGFIDFHYNGSSSDYTSRIIEYPSGKLNIEASNGIVLPQSYNIDGQWVSSYLHLYSSPAQVTNAVLDVSGYLPNDGKAYEILMMCKGISSSSAVSYVWSDAIANPIRVCDVREYSRSCIDTFILPVSTLRQIYLTTSAAHSNSFDIELFAYRRIGTNN